jgi:hypothetical protein
LESLESRVLLSAYTAATAAVLVSDINAANKAGGTNTITLTAPSSLPYLLSSVNNTTNGNNVLPVINKGDNLTIVTGNGTSIGDIIDAGKFGRLFDVASGATLTLKNVTLQNGLAAGSGDSASGGAVYNRGTLLLNEVTVQNNTAAGFPGSSFQKSKPGGPGQDAAGGGIWSNGSLRVENTSVIQGNTALGGNGGQTQLGTGPAGRAFGGGIYIAAGTANITTTTFASNAAEGSAAYGGAVYVAAGMLNLSGDTLGKQSPTGGVGVPGNVAEGRGSLPGDNGYGGAIYIAGGSVTLNGDVVQGNTAFDNQGAVDVGPNGGGMFIASGATAFLDFFTANNTTNNSPNDIWGSYTLPA